MATNLRAEGRLARARRAAAGEPTEFDVLLAGARAGDPDAWTALYHEVAPLVIGYLRAQRLPDPEDVAGEVLLDVVRGIQRFRGDRDKFRSWTLTIAHHRMIDERRRAQRRPSTPLPTEDLPLPAAPDDPLADVVAGFAAAEVAALLAQLSDDQRTVMLLRIVGGLSLKEVATITGKRVNAVKQLQHRATEALRRQLGVAGRRDPAGRNPDAPVDARPGT